MSDSWSYSPCCHSENITAIEWRCKNCGQFTTHLKRVTGTSSELLRKYHRVSALRGERFVDVCPHCERANIWPSQWQCECGNVFSQQELVVVFWEGEEEWLP